MGRYVATGHQREKVPAMSAMQTAPAVPEGSGLEEISFLTIAEVAGALRVSKMTVYRMVHAGELPAIRVGRSFRVPAKAVREYLESAYVTI